MKQIINKLIKKEKEMANKKGVFHLFGLFLRKGAFDKWDLLVSAPWIDKNKNVALKYITSEIQNTLNSKEILKLARVGILDDKDRVLRSFQKTIEEVSHGQIEMQDCNLFNVEIEKAIIITSQRTVKKTHNNANSTDAKKTALLNK